MKDYTLTLEHEISIMVNECNIMYASKDCEKINEWLENTYLPFRKYWISKIEENLFAETWNKYNKKINR
jgi:hypothetical protein